MCIKVLAVKLHNAMFIVTRMIASFLQTVFENYQLHGLLLYVIFVEENLVVK